MNAKLSQFLKILDLKQDDSNYTHGILHVIPHNLCMSFMSDPFYYKLDKTKTILIKWVSLKSK